MLPYEWMLKTFNTYRDMKLWVVALPLPPIAVRGLVYMPDSYTSKVFDGGDNIEHAGIDYKINSVVASSWGPAVLMRVKLGSLVSYQTTGNLVVHAKSCCADVSYYGKSNISVDNTDKKFDVALDVVINKLKFFGSCNPGSHVVIPGAPFLSAIVQYAAAPQESGIDVVSGVDTSAVYLDPWEVSHIFPTLNLSINKLVDNYIGKCAIDRSIRRSSSLASLGAWAVPYLRQMRINNLLMEEPDYESRSIPVIVDSRQENGGSLRSCPIGGTADRELRQEGGQYLGGDSAEADQGRPGASGVQGSDFETLDLDDLETIVRETSLSQTGS